MSGIRATLHPNEITEKELKIHFSKPENGGGGIKAIYFPVFNDDAVILFEDEDTAATVNSHKHEIKERKVYVSPLPFSQPFQELSAQLDPTVTEILQTTESLRDEIQHVGNLNYQYEGNQGTLIGNWYQLEWAWAKIDKFIRSQRHLQEQISGNMDRIGEPNKILPKGQRPIMGDSFHSTKSSPKHRIGAEDEESDDDDDDDDDDDIVVSPSGSKVTDNRPTGILEITNQDDIFETDIPDQQLSDEKSKSGSPVSMATAELKVKRNNVSFIQKDNEHGMTEKETEFKTTKILHDKPEDMRSLEFEHGGLNINIYTGEITLVETDVIVNAAMGPLVNAGGVAKAIARAASPNMQKECDEHVKKHGSLETSEVMHTCAGGSMSDNVKYILHAVGPVWSSAQSQDACQFLLTRTFLNCFNYGNDQLKVTSITLPVISSGVFGCPLELCIKAFMDAILIFASQHEQESLQLKEVHLINNNGDNTALTVLQVRQLIEIGLDKRTSEASQFYRKMEESKSRAKARKEALAGARPKSAMKSGTTSGQRSNSTITASSHNEEPKGDKQSVSKTLWRPLPPVPVVEPKVKGKKK